MSQYMNTDYEEYLISISQIFIDKLSTEDFLILIKNLKKEHEYAFTRACDAFLQSRKCANCEPNIALVLLCTAVEAVSQTTRKYPFKDWIIKYKLNTLENKNQVNIKKEIENAWEEYLKHPERAGALYNFKRFLLDNHPKIYKESPIKISNKKIKRPRSATFEESIDYIYSKFRSYYVHEAVRKIIKRSEMPKKVLNAKQVYILEVYKKHYYHIDIEKLLKWFTNIINKSLYSYLINNTQFMID